MAVSAVSGDREVVRMLNALARGPTPREVDQSANRAMRPMLEDTRSRLRAIRNYPSKYPSIFPKQQKITARHLDKDVVVRKQSASPGVRTFRLGFVGRARFLLHLTEYGTSPHYQPNLFGGWMHPGATPRPTLTPAFEHGKDDVVWAMQDELLDWVERTVISRGGRITRR